MTDNEFDIEDGTEIEIIDDTPVADRGRTLLSPEEEDLEPASEEELSAYSDRVKKRISEATFKFNDQRRKREQAEREREEATRLAKAAIDRLNETQSALAQYERFGVDQAKTRVETELAQVKAQYKHAYESGDSDALAEHAEKIARLAPQHEQYSRFVSVEPEYIEYQPPQQHQSVDPRQADDFAGWQAENPWFGNDPQMTLFARGWHTMVAEQNPQAVGTPEYYREINRLVRENFPDKFEQDAQFHQASSSRASRSSPVTPASRASPSGRQSGGKRKVTLNQSQIRLASRLGLTPQQYAESLIEQEKNQ